jgi:hypothetical protein
MNDPDQANLFFILFQLMLQRDMPPRIPEEHSPAPVGQRTASQTAVVDQFGVGWTVEEILASAG